MSTDELRLKTVAVLGGSYGGNRAAQVLAAGLPSGWRIVLVDRNSHFNHVYNFPRYTVLSGHEHKAFIPYDNLFFNDPSGAVSPHPVPHERIQGTITSLHTHHLTYIPHSFQFSTPAGSTPVETIEEKTLRFDYAVYALGSHLPTPIDLWGSRDIHFLSIGAQEPACPNLKGGVCHASPYTGMKQEGIACLRSRQRRIEVAQRVLVVGGGALGIQFASDIAAIYPRKSVTLLHSRSRLLPRFDDALGDEAYLGLQELGVQIIFGDRLDVSSLDGIRTKGYENQEPVLIKTTKGREIEADLVLLCTGQTPNTSLIHGLDSRTLDPKSRMIRVSRTMQILAVQENVTIGGDSFDDVIHSTSHTLQSVSPPCFDTGVKLDSTPPTMYYDAVSNEMLAQSKADTSWNRFVYPHLFAIGDAADAFGAIKAGHAAYYQGEVAARNVIRLIQGAEKNGDFNSSESDSDEELELEEYVPGPPMIKVSLGLTKSAYEVAGLVGTKDDGTDDLGAAVVWGIYGYRDVDAEGMLSL